MTDNEVPRRRIGMVSLAFTAAGVILALVGLLGVRWTSLASLGPKGAITFGQLRDVYTAAGSDDGPGFTMAYFSWAAFVLLGVSLVCATAAAFPLRYGIAVRAVGIVVGLVCAAATLFVPRLDGGGFLPNYLSSGVGVFLVAGGSVLLAAGAQIGPRRA